MDRRGFLGSLMAVTTAIASGVKLPAGRELAAAPRTAVRVQNDLLALLNDCVPLSIEATHSISGPMTYTIEYLHSPGHKVNETTAMIDSYTKHMRPVSVQFLQKAGDLTKLTVEWM